MAVSPNNIHFSESHGEFGGCAMPYLVAPSTMIVRSLSRIQMQLVGEFRDSLELRAGGNFLNAGLNRRQ
jgi:hypothetical protein